MRNFLLTLAYHGAYFHGSAIQKNACSIQGTLQPILERITGETLALKCCSRTDTGVHARMFCVSFQTRCKIPPERLVAALNASLPDALAPVACEEVPPDFHARYSCRGKKYVYRIRNHPLRDPFAQQLSLLYPYPLDENMLCRDALDFLGTHDFIAFSASGGKVPDTVRTVFLSTVHRVGDDVSFEVAGNGFLYHMVRIMVGTLLDIQAGKLPRGCIPEIFASRQRERAGYTAPARGLFLEEVYYSPSTCGMPIKDRTSSSFKKVCYAEKKNQ